MKKILVVLCVVMIMAFAFAACSSGPAGEPSASKSAAVASSSAAVSSSEAASVSAPAHKKSGVVIKFIPMSTASAYWQALKKGAEDAAAEFGKEWGGITVQFDGPKEDTDLMAQVEIINNSVSAGVDGLLIAVSSPTVPHDAIVNAIKAGTNVICVDQMLDPMDANAFFGTNCVQMSNDVAKYMTEKVLDGTGSYAEMMYNMTSLAAIDRHDGFVKGMTELAPKMKDLGATVTNSDIAGTQTQVTNLIQANPDLKCVFSANDRSAIGTLNAFNALGISGKIALCNVDCNLDTLKAMRAGTIQASALQMPYTQGYEGVKKLLDLFDGKTIDKTGDSGSFLLTKENMDTPEAVKAINQYLAGYKPEDSK